MTQHVTKTHLVTAQANTIFRLMNQAMSAAIEADKSAGDGEINLAISYLMELSPLLESIQSLTDATITLHRTLNR